MPVEDIEDWDGDDELLYDDDDERMEVLVFLVGMYHVY
jgi:hypothetical protein